MVNLKRHKIYKLVCTVSRLDRQFTFNYIQPAPDVRVAYRLMRERFRNYYGFHFVEFISWSRLDKDDYLHFNIY